MKFFHTLAFCLYPFAAAPLLAFKSIKGKGFFSSISERLGGGAWHRASYQGRWLWFHAASVGELNGVWPLLKKVKSEEPQYRILLTVTSLTGKEEAVKKGFADMVAFLPLDFRGVVRKILRQVKPETVVFFETELWPNLCLEARALGIPLMLVNARISDYSFPRYLRLKTFFKPILNCFHFIAAQTPIDRERFLLLGGAEIAASVTGCTKYEELSQNISEERLDIFRNELQISKDYPLFVAGSVREGEYEIVIDAYQRVKRVIPTLQMIVAPRHPELFERVARALESSGLNYNRRSKTISERRDVVLLDTLGELLFAYGLSDVSFVGGTLVDIGGHNPFEPASFSVPVIVGPFTRNVRDAVAALWHAGGTLVVKDAQELSASIGELITHPQIRVERGQKAKQVVLENLGATDKVFAMLSQQILSRARESQAVIGL